MPPTPKELGKPLLPPTQVTRVRFAPSGELLAACLDGTVRRWDVSGKEPTERPALSGTHKGWVTAVTSGDGKMFTADSWGGLITWHATGNEWKPCCTVYTAHDGWLRALAVSPDGERAVSCGKDGFVRWWATDDGRRTAELDIQADALSVVYAADGKSVFVGDLFGIVREIAVRGRKELRRFDAKELYKLDRIQDVGGAKVLLLDPAGKTLFVGGAIPTGGGFVECTPLLLAFDAESGKRLSQWKGDNNKDGYVTDLAWHPDGFVAGTTSGQPGQGKFFLWKPGDAAPFFVNTKMPNCHSVAIHPNGSLIAVSGTNANSSGNGRVKGKDGDYPANTSPIQVWRVG